MKTWQSVAFGLLVGLLLAGAVILVAMPPRGQAILLSTPLPPAAITVYVQGAVVHPGLYSLPPLSRVNDAILAAGGLLSSANPGLINPAARLNDGDKVVVPSLEDTPAPTGGKAKTIPSATPAFPLNINTASRAELAALPGIGEGKASAILTYRQEHGPFTQLEGLMDVPGIGPGIFAEIRQFITLEE
jgi:competence protein ComEA